MSVRFTIMGCGNSSGVPAVGNYWGACDPYELRNRRSRCSLAVQSDDTTLIVDTGPDFREQMNRENISGYSVSAVLYTHQHGDHVSGIDDLRSVYYQKGRKLVPVYAKETTMSELQSRFFYLFKGDGEGEYQQVLSSHIIAHDDFGKKMRVGNIDVIPFEMDHGTCTALGYRFGDVSYCVDMKRLDDVALEIMKGSRIWIVDAAAYKNPNNHVHANLQSIYDYNHVIGAEKVYLTSLSSQMDYKTLEAELPEGYSPAFDGLHFESLV